MRTEKREFGDFGEQIVAMFLMKQGFDIVDRNYLKPWGEIDIVAKKGENTYFVEVKSIIVKKVTHETEHYNPAENVHLAKLKRLSRVIQTYISSKNLDDNWKFIVALVFVGHDKKRAKVKIIEDIVL